MTRTARTRLHNYIRFATSLLLVVILLFPIFWMIRLSITPRAEMFDTSVGLIPSSVNLIGYVELFEISSFFVFFRNSVIVGVATVAVSLSVGTLAAYSFSRFSYPGKKILMLATLSAQMFPWALLLISLYLLYSRLSILDTRFGVMLAHTTFALPLTIWMVKGYFDTIPIELEESAYIDGCGRLRTFMSIIIPISAPGIMAAAIYIFIFSWNDFIFGLTLTISDQVRTLAPGIALTFIGENQFQWNQMMAAAVVTTLPVVIVFVFLQKTFVSGLTAGAVKG